jgi:probable phosphomutase (TIGR03848 family)
MTGRSPRIRASVVLFVRHGLTPTTGKILPGRAPGLGLSDAGLKQAEATAKRIAALPRISAIYASPLERARETAAPIGRAVGLPVQVERGLSELDVGEWTGRSLARVSLKREWRSVQQHPSGFRFPGGESFVEAQARMVGTIERVVERHRGETIVLVSHADPIKMALAHALGVHLDLFQRIAVDPASVTVIVYRPGGPTVVTVNSIAGDVARIDG